MSRLYIAPVGTDWSERFEHTVASPVSVAELELPSTLEGEQEVRIWGTTEGEAQLVESVIDAGPDALAHNVETVERLQQPVRDRRASYKQSMDVLDRIAESDCYSKTSLMLGVDEYAHEVYRTLSDLHEIGVDIVTLGQYLQPSPSHLEVSEYVHPGTFETWRQVAEEELDFLYCAAGPMVRSSYRAGELFINAIERDGMQITDARQVVHS